MKYLLPFLLIAATTGLAQEQSKTYDFSKVDPQKTTVEEVDSMTKSVWRETYYSSGLDSLRQLRDYLAKRNFSPKYYAFAIGYAHSFASLDYLNSGLRALGLPEMSQRFGGIPFGFDV